MGKRRFGIWVPIRPRFASGRAAKIDLLPSRLGDILFDIALDRFPRRAPIEAAEPDSGYGTTFAGYRAANSCRS
jgi:hypothetical protein